MDNINNWRDMEIDDDDAFTIKALLYWKQVGTKRFLADIATETGQEVVTIKRFLNVMYENDAIIQKDFNDNISSESIYLSIMGRIEKIDQILLLLRAYGNQLE